MLETGRFEKTFPAPVKRFRSWGEYLKQMRSRRFRSAREFCVSTGIRVSYPQYSRYESGEQLPGINQAIEILNLLEVPLLDGLLEWNRAQISDSRAQKEIEESLSQLRGRASGAGPGAVAVKMSTTSKPAQKLSLDDVIVFNRSHLELFRSNPYYRDLFTYINSFAPRDVPPEEIGQAFGIEQKAVSKMLDKLCELGVIVSVDGAGGVTYRATKSNFYFPDDEDFFELRNGNLKHNVDLILERLSFDDLSDRRGVRGLVTRELTPSQLAELVSRAEDLLRETVDMPETDAPEGIYSVCILMGERFRRP